MAVLRRGGRALDAVVESIVVLEDDPRLNAGTGSRMRIDGRTQMDAALMDGDLEAGGVAAIERVKNPIRVARDVFGTPHRHLEESLAKIRKGTLPRYQRKWKSVHLTDTVGAVARDRRGRFAAGTSTGGTAFMLPGRVGDSPIVGSGLYAGPAGAVSATGFGEEIMKRVLSKFVYDRLANGLSAQRAADRGVALFPKTVPVGVVAVGQRGWGESCNRHMAFFASSVRRTF